MPVRLNIDIRTRPDRADHVRDMIVVVIGVNHMLCAAVAKQRLVVAVWQVAQLDARQTKVVAGDRVALRRWVAVLCCVL